jgi:hypothetical protein
VSLASSAATTATFAAMEVADYSRATIETVSRYSGRKSSEHSVSEMSLPHPPQARASQLRDSRVSGAV